MDSCWLGLVTDSPDSVKMEWLTLPGGRRTLRSVLTVAAESSLLNMKIFGGGEGILQKEVVCFGGRRLLEV
ncbi:hypothetical protein LEMLEM_LOCUS11516 [Lemmus lemmus]